MKRISDKRKKQLLAEKELKEKLLERSDGHCECCGELPDWRGLSVHHKIYRSQGGKSDLDNCEMLCGKCHSARHGINEV
jgi:5-methylcytosine-specific restriction endonuclease McrA